MCVQGGSVRRNDQGDLDDWSGVVKLGRTGMVFSGVGFLQCASTSVLVSLGFSRGRLLGKVVQSM